MVTWVVVGIMIMVSAYFAYIRGEKARYLSRPTRLYTTEILSCTETVIAFDLFILQLISILIVRGALPWKTLVVCTTLNVVVFSVFLMAGWRRQSALMVLGVPLLFALLAGGAVLQSGHLADPLPYVVSSAVAGLPFAFVYQVFVDRDEAKG